MDYRVEASRLAGRAAVTTSKSHTMRAVLLASMAEGTSRVRRPLPSPDTAAMVAACRALGARIEETGDGLRIEGAGAALCVPGQVMDVGNSGQVLRFGAAMAARLPLYSVFTGDASICGLRPMQPLLDALTQLGAMAVSTRNNGLAPIVIRGPVRPGAVEMDGQDSQPVSAVLLLAAFLPGTTTITVRQPGEKPWIDMTLYWLERLGVACVNEAYERYTVTGRAAFPGFDYTVPGDWSSAAFPMAASLVTNSPLVLENMDMADPQGDKAIVDVFRRMGAAIQVDDAAKTVHIGRHSGLHGIEADVNAIIDAVPVLATVACFADSPTTLTGASIARRKESDRLAAITRELGKMGARIDEFDDGLTIHPAVLRGAEVDSCHDHRIAMSLVAAGLACGETVVRNTACVAKSFPGFAGILRGLGARVHEDEGR